MQRSSVNVRRCVVSIGEQFRCKLESSKIIYVPQPTGTFARITLHTIYIYIIYTYTCNYNNNNN